MSLLQILLSGSAAQYELIWWQSCTWTVVRCGLVDVNIYHLYCALGLQESLECCEISPIWTWSSMNCRWSAFADCFWSGQFRILLHGLLILTYFFRITMHQDWTRIFCCEHQRQNCVWFTLMQSQKLSHRYCALMTYRLLLPISSIKICFYISFILISLFLLALALHQFYPAAFNSRSYWHSHNFFGDSLQKLPTNMDDNSMSDWNP
jgi:hypothetical protein